jgi:competence ComEA-like helix-hairpin-helix protein
LELERNYMPRPGAVTLAITIICVTFACTTRRVYERPANRAVASADAININNASAAELERLPRIGPKTAEKIIAFRTANGPFLRVEELMQIHGISEKKFFEIKPYLRTD